MTSATFSARTKIPSLGCGYFACAVLVALGLGLLAIAQAKWNEKEIAGTWAFGMTGALFCAGGIGFVGPMHRAVARARERQQRELAHPAEPWRWEPTWTRSTGIPESGRRQRGAGLFFGLMAMALSAPGVFALPEEIKRGNYAILLVLLFPLVGGAFLWAGAVDAWRRRKYGLARFVPASLPLPLGGEVAGMVIVGRPVHPERPGRVTLECWRTTCSRRGGKRSTHGESLAHVEREIEAAAWTLTAGEAHLFVQLPARGGSATTLTPLDEDHPSCEWRLKVHVPTSGADFVAEFVLPVFEVAGEATREHAGAAIVAGASVAERAEVWRTAGVSEEPQPGALGGTALCLPAGVGRRHLASPLAMTLIFAGVGAVLWFSPAPAAFAVFVGGFALLPLVAVVALAHPGGERVWLERDALCVRSVKGTERRLAWERVAVLEHRPNVGIGSRQFFRVQARCPPEGARKFGRRFEIAALVPGCETAAHVVAWLEERAPAAR